MNGFMALSTNLEFLVYMGTSLQVDMEQLRITMPLEVQGTFDAIFPAYEQADYVRIKGSKPLTNLPDKIYVTEQQANGMRCALMTGNFEAVRRAFPRVLNLALPHERRYIFEDDLSIDSAVALADFANAYAALAMVADSYQALTAPEAAGGETLLGKAARRYVGGMAEFFLDDFNEGNGDPEVH